MATNRSNKQAAAKSFLSIAPERLTMMAPSLRTVLHNSLYMYSLYKKYRWHVSGEDFYQYYKLFGRHAAEQLAIADAVAERLRTIGSDVEAMPADVAASATIKELSNVSDKPKDMVACLLHCHEQYLKQLREAVDMADDTDDEGTEDMLDGLVLRVHEKEVWFLRSAAA